MRLLENAIDNGSMLTTTVAVESKPTTNELSFEEDANHTDMTVNQWEQFHTALTELFERFPLMAEIKGHVDEVIGLHRPCGDCLPTNTEPKCDVDEGACPCGCHA